MLVLSLIAHPDPRLALERYGTFPAVSPNCARHVRVTDTSSGKAVDVTVADVRWALAYENAREAA